MTKIKIIGEYFHEVHAEDTDLVSCLRQLARRGDDDLKDIFAVYDARKTNVFEGLSEVAKEIDEWQRNHPQIGKATIYGAMNKLEDEVAEALEASINEDDSLLSQKLTNVFFLLVQCCQLSSTDLVGGIKHKLEINKARAWAEPAEDGTVSHKKVGTQLAKEPK